MKTFGNRQLAAISPKDVREWYAETLTNRPTMCSHAYWLLRTIMGSAVNDELIDANPCPITGAGRSKRVHKIRPASVAELAILTEAMPERLPSWSLWPVGARCASEKPSSRAPPTSTYLTR